jgi:aminoglycoside phosphotransferase (APT) family kinase protein
VDVTLTQKEKAEQARRLPPMDLDRSPEVEDFLRSIGAGTFLREGLTSPAGRNEAWIGATTTGSKVFVKRVTGFDAAPRMERIVSFQRFAEALGESAVPAPRLLGHDTERRIVAFEAVEDNRNGAELMVDEEFTEDVAARIGAALATVHAAPPPGTAEIQSTPPPLPAPHLFEALPEPMFELLSFAETEAWNLLQADPELARAVTRLREREAAAPQTPIHGDLRMDQVLVAGGEVLLIDWEEFRLGDAARDVGAFAGEWLYRSILDIVTDRGGQPPIVDDLGHEDILRRGVANLERQIPLVRAFWKAYREVRPDLDEGFVTRATAFAGWHTIDRLLAGSGRRSTVTGIERAAAGVGRSALVDPDRFGAVIGLEEH